MVALLQDILDINRLLLCHAFENFAIGNLNMRSHVICTVPQVDFEIFVSKDLLFVAKNGIGEPWVEARNRVQTGFGRGKKADLKSIGGAGNP